MIFFGGLERCRQTQINFRKTHMPPQKKRQKKRFGLPLSDCLKKMSEINLFGNEIISIFAYFFRQLKIISM